MSVEYKSCYGRGFLVTHDAVEHLYNPYDFWDSDFCHSIDGYKDDVYFFGLIGATVEPGRFQILPADDRELFNRQEMSRMLKEFHNLFPDQSLRPHYYLLGCIS